MERKISGAILAGGGNRRFNGIVKSNILVEGKTIVSRLIEVMDDFFSEIIIITNTPEEFKDYTKYKIVCDQIKDIGPLGGIHAALKTSTKEAVFIFAGDMPFPDRNLINYLISKYYKSRCQVVIPRVNDYIEPLLAIYNVSVVGHLETYVSERNNYAVRNFLKEVKVCFAELENKPEISTALTNINYPSDLKRLNTWSPE